MAVALIFILVVLAVGLQTPFASIAIALLAVPIAAMMPTAAVIAIPASVGLVYHPLPFGGASDWRIAAHEALLLSTCMGIGIRAVAMAITRWHKEIGSFPRRVSNIVVNGSGPLGILLVVAGTISLFTLADPGHRQESLREYRWVIVEPVLYSFLARWYLQQAPARLVASGAFVLAGAGVALFGLATLVNGSALSVEGVTRISGTYPHPNALALYLERAVVFGLGLSAVYRRRIEPWWFALSAICLLALVLTFSRGALLGVGIALIPVLVLGQRRRLATALAAAGIGLLVVLAAFASERFGSMFDGGSGSLRLAIWSSSLAMIRDFPLFGVGLDQFLYMYAPRYVAPEAWPERFTSHPHNIVLDLWLRLGIMGLVVAAVYTFKCVHWAQRAVKTNSRIGLAAVGTIGVGVIHGLVDNSYFLPDLALAFWFLTALLDLEANHSPMSTRAPGHV